MKALSTLLIYLCVFNFKAYSNFSNDFMNVVFAFNPILKTKVAKENFVRQTSVGTLYANYYDSEMNNQLIYIGATAAWSPYRIDLSEKKEVFVNANLGASSYAYHSWVVMQTLVSFWIENESEKIYKVKTPDFIEKDFIIFTEAMRYLDQSVVFDVTKKADYYYSEFGYARDLRLSMFDLHQLWKRSKKLFYKKIRRRAQLLKRRVITVSDYLQRDDLTKDQVDAALRVKEIWESIQ